MMTTELTETEARIARIVDLMNAGLWVPAQASELGREWGITADRVRHLSAEAHRLIRAAGRGDLESIRETILLEIDNVRLRARGRQRWRDVYVEVDGKVRRRSLQVTEPDFQSELRALWLKAHIHGLTVERLELTARSDPFEGWTTARLEAFVAGRELEEEAEGGQAPTNGSGNGNGNGSVH